MTRYERMLVEKPFRVYQTRSVEDMIADPLHVLFQKPGLGKTRTFLEAFRRLSNDMISTRALVIAPKAVCELTWEQEAEEWGYDFSFIFLYGPKKNQLLEQEADVYLMNPEGVPWLFGKPNRTRRRWLSGAWRDWAFKPDVLCLDELTKWKNRGERAKTLRRYLEEFPHRYGLTGTPAPNGYLDLHGQMFMIDRGEALGPTVTPYRTRWFMPPAGCPQDDRRFFTQWVLQDEAAKTEIEEAIAPRVTSIEAADYIELPQLVSTITPVALPPVAKRAYDEMTSDGCCTLPGSPNPFTAESSGAAMGKGRQISNGALYEQDELGYPTDRWASIHNAKLTALDGLLQQIDGPVMIAYEFRHDLARLRDAYPSARSLSAGQTGEVRREVVGLWNQKKLDLLFVQPQAAGHGLNLQSGGNSIIWMTPPWDLELRIQMVGRLLRQGQSAANVFEYFLCGEGTADRRVASVLSQKAELQQSLLDALKIELEIVCTLPIPN